MGEDSIYKSTCVEGSWPAFGAARESSRESLRALLPLRPCLLCAQLGLGPASLAELLWASASLCRRWEMPSNVCSARGPGTRDLVGWSTEQGTRLGTHLG